jgi:hypothetical protein
MGGIAHFLVVHGEEKVITPTPKLRSTNEINENLDTKFKKA